MDKVFFRRKNFALTLIGLGVVVILVSALLDFIRGETVIKLGLIQYGGLGLGALLLAVGLSLFSQKAGTFFVYLITAVSAGLFAIGVALTLLNIFGELVSLRNPALYQGVFYAGKLRVPQYTASEASDLMKKIPDETTGEYAHRVTKLVFDSTVHLWENLPDYSEYNHHVPIYENYFLWAMAYFDPQVYTQYQFCNPEKAIERSVSICDQSSRIMQSIWETNGMKARMVTLDGHTVAEARLDKDQGIWWVLDADYGVVLEYDIKTLEQHPEIIKASYMQAGYSAEIAEKLAGYYGPDGNYAITDRTQCEKEALFYRLKWPLPVIAATPFCLIVLISRRRVMHHVK